MTQPKGIKPIIHIRGMHSITYLIGGQWTNNHLFFHYSIGMNKSYLFVTDDSNELSKELCDAAAATCAASSPMLTRSSATERKHAV